ncbi:alanine or glycine:cation symporter, AGCS family [Kytococcus aerolatus]|uniref:Alanine or glycine:cation symporter, AGCS family n=1 Tax=Kytococcus aerolatus TaxID=592308 RepID=A0A212U240_9MICO|nr:alanine/glycine:cation symporter family protein [Kytococcus aerolatus]SNC72196.1 alanine or glycine:cation symporter, AGCS family [Kytococcus aerolatus]
MDTIETWLADAGAWIWGPMTPLVLLAGIAFTVMTGAVQIRMLPAMFQTLLDPPLKDENGEDRSVSTLAAFSVSAAGRIGTANIAGVSAAVALGGAGSVFWMWLIALVGGATAFVESTISQLYKVREGDAYRGGGAVVYEKALGTRVGGVLVAVMVLVCAGISFNMLQANTIRVAVDEAIPTEAAWVNWAVAAVVALLTAVVVIGGVRRIGRVAEMLVPFMAGAYLLLGLSILLINIDQVPEVFGNIFGQAFGLQAIAAGSFMGMVMEGVKRAMFSNEAGMGLTGHAAASASVSHPVKQGFAQTLGVYLDTLVVCTITAFIVLSADPDLGGEEAGAELASASIVDAVGSWGAIALGVILFTLAFTSVLADYYYGESNVQYLTSNRGVLWAFKVVFVALTFLGCLVEPTLLWALADFLFPLLAVLTIVSLLLLAPKAAWLLKDYRAQLAEGRNPALTSDRLPAEWRGITCWEPEDSMDHADAVAYRREHLDTGAR